MRLNVRRLAVMLATLGLSMSAALAWGQKESVRPGINDSFQDPNVAEFVERFEREGREVYDKRDAIVAACNVKAGSTVADVGAGTGLFTRLLAKATGPEGRVYAVDIADAFVKRVEEKCREENIANVTGIVCKVDSAMLPDSGVDLVYICDTYHHFEFPYRTMSSIHRALREGGEVVIVDFKRIEGESSDWILQHVRCGKEVVIEEVKSAGFELVEEQDLLKDNYMLRFRRK
ncbi:MAG: methyltransferase domain-containing protein [Pirellulaceae bacterium]